jgi:hypothetical protein
MTLASNAMADRCVDKGLSCTSRPIQKVDSVSLLPCQCCNFLVCMMLIAIEQGLLLIG